MSWTILQLLAGVVVLTAGAELLVRGAAALALRFGLSPLAVGLTVVAMGTSAPELVVCVKAALSGQGGMAIGNAVGSNIFNLAAILGLVALIRPIACQSTIIRREIPAMVGATVLLLPMIFLLGETGAGAAGTLTRPEGAVLLTLAVLYTAATLHFARQGRAEVKEEFAADLLPEQSASAEELQQSSVLASLGSLVLGLVLLVAGAELLVAAAVVIAKLAGMSDLVIGITIIGAGTSLPELATSAVAAIRGESDIALGNVVGSSIFNILGILGATVTVQPLPVETGVLMRDLPFVVVLSILCWIFTATGRVISRIEGGVLLAAYLGYIVALLAGF